VREKSQTEREEEFLEKQKNKETGVKQKQVEKGDGGG